MEKKENLSEKTKKENPLRFSFFVFSNEGVFYEGVKQVDVMGCGRSIQATEPSLLSVAPGAGELSGASISRSHTDKFGRATSFDLQSGASQIVDVAAVLEVGALVGTALLDIGRLSHCMLFLSL